MTETESCHDVCCNRELDASRGHQIFLTYAMFTSTIRIQAFLTDQIQDRNGYWFFVRRSIEEPRQDLRVKEMPSGLGHYHSRTEPLGNAVNTIAFIPWEDLRAGVSGTRIN